MEIIGIIFWALLGFSILVFIHEFGHYLLARWTGIGVEKFSIGFGRPIIKFRLNNVDWQFGWILFGGYCKMKGQEDFKVEDREIVGTKLTVNGKTIETIDGKHMIDGKEIDVVGGKAIIDGKSFDIVEVKMTSDGATIDSDDFYVRPPWARLLTVLGGPVFNIILGILLLTGIYFFIGEQVIKNNTIIVKDQFKQELPELKTGDFILAVNGKEVKYWNEVQQNIVHNLNQDSQQFTVKRDNKLLNVTYSFDHDKILNHEFGFDIDIDKIVKVGKVLKDSAAEKAGLKVGDEIISIDGKTVKNGTDPINFINNVKGDPEHSFLIKRGNETKTLKIKPDFNTKEKKRLIGIYLNPPEIPLEGQEHVTYSFVESVPKGLEDAWGLITLTIKQFGILSKVKTQTVQENVAGPIGIFVMIGKVGNSGLKAYINFIAIISILLGVFNLLPIPVVDGGHVVLTLIEMVRRKPLNLKLVQRIQMIGLFIILSLFVLITANDLYKLIF